MRRAFALIIAVALLVCCAACARPAEESPSSGESEGVVSQAQEISSPSSEAESSGDSPENEYIEYQYTATLGTIRKYHSTDFMDGTYTYNVSLPETLELKDYGGIYRGEVKVGELCPVVMIKDGESFSDFFLFDPENKEDQEIDAQQFETGTYQNSSGNTVYYDVGEFYFHSHVFIYSFLVPLEENVAAWVWFMDEEYNRSEDEPLYRSIVNTITPVGMNQ